MILEIYFNFILCLFITLHIEGWLLLLLILVEKANLFLMF